MTTYYATNPRRYVQEALSSSGPALNPDDRIEIRHPDGSVEMFANIVTGYKMVINEDGKTYDSFVQKQGRPEWIAKSGRRAIDRDALQSEVDAGHLHL